VPSFSLSMASTRTSFSTGALGRGAAERAFGFGQAEWWPAAG